MRDGERQDSRDKSLQRIWKSKCEKKSQTVRPHTLDKELTPSQV